MGGGGIKGHIALRVVKASKEHGKCQIQTRSWDFMCRW